VIRDLAAADRAEFLRLWQDYLRFYKVTLTPEVTEATWARLLDPASPLAARVAFGASGLAGFAIHLHHPSSWVPGEDCYLEDLFIDAAARGQGLGRALIEDLIALARAKGWHRLYWHTDEGNLPARRLYDSIIPSDGHIRYRLPLT
jgi:GNAT superfamily N-acetyltransferase